MVNISIGGIGIGGGGGRRSGAPRESVSETAGLLFGGVRAAPVGEASFRNDDGSFAAHYAANVRPLVERFERDRIDALHSFRRNLICFAAFAVVAVCALALILATATLTGNDPIGLVVGAAVLIAVAYFIARAPVRAYKAGVKTEVFPQIFSFFGADFRFRSDSPLTVAALEPSGVIPYFEREKREDYVSGTYRDVALELFEAHLTKTEGSGKNRRTVTVFDGMFVRLSMNKKFSGRTVVKRDAGAILNWMADRFNRDERVRLEDPRFEDRFEVYSTDQVEARYLLTPAFMERLLHVAETFRGGALQASFYDDCLLLMIPTRDNRFEPGSIFAPATFVGEADTILREMAEIFAVVDVLKLNERTGL